MRAARPVPPAAWMLSGAVAVGLAVLGVRSIAAHGSSAFYAQSDAFFFRICARAPLGPGRGFAAVGQLSEAPYRYGRIGLPLLGWLLALGRPAWVGWPPAVVSLGAIAAVPGLGAVVLSDLGAAPIAAAGVLLAPGLLFSSQHVYADPLAIALLLLACVLDGRGKRAGALTVVAGAILVKEIAALALIPWFWQAIKRRDRDACFSAAAALVPYVIWSVWIRARLGEFPFLAHTYSRTGALALPFAGIAKAMSAHTPGVGAMVVLTAVTVVLGAVAGRTARGTRIGQLAIVYAVLTVCLGMNTVAYPLECERVMAVAQVFAVLGIAVTGPAAAATLL